MSVGRSVGRPAGRWVHRVGRSVGLLVARSVARSVSVVYKWPVSWSVGRLLGIPGRHGIVIFVIISFSVSSDGDRLKGGLSIRLSVCRAASRHLGCLQGHVPFRNLIGTNRYRPILNALFSAFERVELTRTIYKASAQVLVP